MKNMVRIMNGSLKKIVPGGPREEEARRFHRKVKIASLKMVLAVTNQKKVQAVITADTRAICAQSDAAEAKDMSVLSNATTMTEGAQEITEEGRVTAAAANKDEDPASEKSETEGEDEEILAFITDRKTLKKEEKDGVGEVSKKCIRDKKKVETTKENHKNSRRNERDKKHCQHQSKQQKEESSFQR